MARRSSTARQHEAAASEGRTATRRTSSGSKAVVRPMGRPTALTDRVEETILSHLMSGMSIDTACALAGIGTTTFHRWMQRGDDARQTLDSQGVLSPEEDRFRDFREAVLDARAQAEARAVGIVMKAMHGGFVTSERPVTDVNGDVQYDPEGNVLYERTMTPPDGRLALQYLQRARPKDWSQQAANINAKVEVSGPDGAPVQIEHTVQQVTDLTSRLMEVRQQFEDEKALAAGEDGGDEGAVEAEWSEA